MEFGPQSDLCAVAPIMRRPLVLTGLAVERAYVCCILERYDAMILEFRSVLGSEAGTLRSHRSYGRAENVVELAAGKARQYQIDKVG